MNAEKLKRSFDPYYEVPLHIWEAFADRCETVSVQKEQILKHAHERERYFYFILQGSAGIFLWKKANFVCLDFAFENSFYCDYMSFLSGEPSPLQTMALEDSGMLRISRKNFFDLGARPAGQTILRIAAEISFSDKQQQQIDLLTKGAAERYRALNHKFPGIMLRTPQKYIASYLGITPQSLSRLRKTVYDKLP